MPVLTHNGKQLTFVWDVPGFPQETFMVGQARATSRIRCNYEERQTLIDSLIGYSYVDTVGTKRVIRRLLPFQYPDHPNLWCVGAPNVEGLTPYGTMPLKHFIVGLKNLVGFDVPSVGQPNYIDARITLQFSTLPYSVLTDQEVGSTDFAHGWSGGMPDEGDALKRGIKRYIHRHAVPAGKYITIPGNFLYYRRSGTPLPQQSGAIFVPAMDLKYDWFQVPLDALPIRAWNQIPGCVNDAEFDGFPAQTLLCLQPTFRQEVSALGTPECVVSYTMRFLPNWDNPLSGSGENRGTAGLYPGDNARGMARGHNWVWTIVGGVGSRDPDAGAPNSLEGRLVLRELYTRGTTVVENVTITHPTKGPMTVKRPKPPLAGGSNPYKTADFRRLFRPDALPGDLFW